MELITGTIQHYAWGSREVLADFLGCAVANRPWAEIWFGAHPLGPTLTPSGVSLQQLIAHDPNGTLGTTVISEFGPRLPFLLKFIAPDQPLSLQVHPSKSSAAAGWQREEKIGVPLQATERNYRDANHKPELIYALTRLEALCGFRTPRRALEIMTGLASPLARTLVELMRAHPGNDSLEYVARYLLEIPTRPDATAVAETVSACEERLHLGASPSVRADRIVTSLAAAYPGDPAVILALTMNPVTLQAGQTLFTPAGALHCYLQGFGLEVMADSDNVLRAGLTEKHVDISEALANVVFHGAPPVRIAPEQSGPNTETFYVPVPDFQLSITRVNSSPTVVPGRGPRLITCLDEPITVDTHTATATLNRGEAAFVTASDGQISAVGSGRLAQVAVP